MNLSQFIVHYPDKDDDRYIELMGRMMEFRELLFPHENGEVHDFSSQPYVNDPFFSNHQMLIGRWISPYTNNRTCLIRWDPGTGKTRAGLIFALTWRQFSSHKRAIIISNSDIVLRAIDNEVVRYTNYDVELEKGIYKSGKRGHGKTIRSSRYVIKQGFDRHNITAFMNKLRQRFEQEKVLGGIQNLDDFIRERYRGYVVIIDEVHQLRASETEKKQQYDNLITFLDAVRDVCPILLMTATPIVNTVSDLFSIIGMMHPPWVRRDIERETRDWKSDPNPGVIIDRVLDKYAKGMISDRTSTGVVPEEDYLPGPYNFNENGRITFSIRKDPEDGDPVPIMENLFPVFMSQYQTEYTALREAGESAIKEMRVSKDVEGLFSDKNIGVIGNIRLIYDFVPPFIEGEGYLKTEDMIYEEESTGKYIPSSKSIIRHEDGDEENIFKVYWYEASPEETEAWNRVLKAYYASHGIPPGGQGYTLFAEGTLKLPLKDKGLGKYSAKYAMLIWMLEFHPLMVNKMGYIHTLWVENGTKLIAASLYANGWEQYMGHEAVAEPLYRTNASGARELVRRFGIIDGSAKNTKATQISRIMDAANNPSNRDGSILATVLGSRKSGISISFLNALYVIGLSREFNKATKIQSHGRVFRANSIPWLKGIAWRILVADIIALPSIPDVEELEEESMAYMEDLANGQINNVSYASLRRTDNVVFDVNPYTIEMYMLRLAEIKDRVSRYAMESLRKVSIENIIGSSIQAEQPPITRNHALLYGEVSKDIIKSEILGSIPGRWEYKLDPRDMYAMSSGAELIAHYTVVHNRYGMVRPLYSYGDMMTVSHSHLSLAYERNFFLTEGSKLYSPRAVEMALDVLQYAPKEPIAFYQHLSASTLQDIKVIILEMSLVFPEALLVQEGMNVASARVLMDSVRPMVLDLYRNFWEVYGEGRIVHILWYGIRDNSYLTKEGIMAKANLKTRIIGYDGYRTKEEWNYMESVDREVVYLSPLAHKILMEERAVIAKARSYGYDQYVHFSVFNGSLRFKDIEMDDKRKSKAIVLGLDTYKDLHILTQMLEMSMQEIDSTYGDDIVALNHTIYIRSQELGILIVR